MLKEDLIQDIQKKRANIAVIGMGYVGLPLAVTFANAGFSVTGIDPIQEKVDMINRGESYISDISNAQLRKHIDSGRIRATTDYATLKEIDAVSICVPTPLRKTGDPDMSFIAQASEDIAPYLHRSMIIVLESSTYPGTTREFVLPKLTANSDLKVGADPKGREELAAKTGIDRKLILEWVNHADLYRIKGVGQEYSDLLEEAGVDTVVELATRKPENLHAKILEVNAAKKLVRRPPSAGMVADWVLQAKELPRVVTH